jgi:hypothetical protein
MANKVDIEGYEHEVLGTCTTNPRVGSRFKQKVEARHLWSFAQEEALVALSEQSGDKCWRLISDPERRAKRIAARYADLYFKSSEKSQGKLQLYWPALAAFVVKDIVEAYRYSREAVLKGGWENAARTSGLSSLGSEVISGASPYEHCMRVYAALAKGNLWLFQDIYPWLWYVLEYGLNNDGTLNSDVLQSDVGARNTASLQDQSKKAIEELPFNVNWLSRCKSRMATDPVFTEASKCFETQPAWGGMDGGYGQHEANAAMAHRYVKQHIKQQDNGYHLPTAGYWTGFNEAYYVMEESRKELGRVANDAAATGRLQKISKFAVTDSVKKTYTILIKEHAASDSDRFSLQKDELNEIARQEQLNVLQPLIYDDSQLIQTMNLNHDISRRFPSISPRYAVVYSARPSASDSNLKTVFDEPKGLWDQTTGAKASLPNPNDRMKYVSEIAKDFNRLMANDRSYMDGELQKIRGWLSA